MSLVENEVVVVFELEIEFFVVWLNEFVLEKFVVWCFMIECYLWNYDDVQVFVFCVFYFGQEVCVFVCWCEFEVG